MYYLLDNLIWFASMGNKLKEPDKDGNATPIFVYNDFMLKHKKDIDAHQPNTWN